MRMRCWGLAAVVALVAFPALAADGAPKGWSLAGTAPQFYRVGVDEEHHAYIESKPGAVPVKFGTLMQEVRAKNYLGKRVRFRASVKSEGLSEWCALWMRVDRGNEMLAFDNMQTRPIQGTTDWKTYEVVEDVPVDATSLAFGAFLRAQGKMWVDHISLEVVGKDVPVTVATRMTMPEEPVNLDFRQ